MMSENEGYSIPAAKGSCTSPQISYTVLVMSLEPIICDPTSPCKSRQIWLDKKFWEHMAEPLRCSTLRQRSPHVHFKLLLNTLQRPQWWQLSPPQSWAFIPSCWSQWSYLRRYGFILGLTVVKGCPFRLRNWSVFKQARMSLSVETPQTIKLRKTPTSNLSFFESGVHRIHLNINLLEGKMYKASHCANKQPPILIRNRHSTEKGVTNHHPTFF